MALMGRLEDLALSDIIQIIYLSKKSGVLVLNDNQHSGKIYFKIGLIAAARSSKVLEKLHDLLLSNSDISKEQFDKALDILATDPVKTIEETLLTTGAIDSITLDHTATRYIREIVEDFTNWSSGSFQFMKKTMQEVESEALADQLYFYKDGLTPHELLAKDLKMRGKNGQLVGEEQLVQPQAHGEEVNPRQDTDRVDTDEEAAEDYTCVASEEETEKTLTIESISPEIQPVETIVPDLGEDNGLKYVVIADDETLMRNMIQQHLEKIGYNVLAMESIDSAIQAIDLVMRKKQVPVVITDLLMPQTDGKGFLGGLELLKSIHEDYSDVPVIMMTDQTDPEIRYQCFRYGVRNYLFKPDRSQHSFEAFSADMHRFTGEIGFCIQNAFKDLEGISKALVAPVEKKEDFEHEFDKILKTDVVGKQDTFPVGGEIERFKQIFYEMKNLREASEIILLILRYAAECLERTIFLLVKENRLYGLGGFGVTKNGAPITRYLHELQIPLDLETPFKEVMLRKQTLKGEFNNGAMQDMFVKYIGRPKYNEFILIPVFNEDNVMALLYGDNAHLNQPIRKTDTLEIFITQAEIAMENAFLQRKLKSPKPGNNLS